MYVVSTVVQYYNVDDDIKWQPQASHRRKSTADASIRSKQTNKTKHQTPPRVIAGAWAKAQMGSRDPSCRDIDPRLATHTAFTFINKCKGEGRNDAVD